ncbi:hypothetical protein [Streptomyces sp. NPDC048641]|uniref:hypothetical protein n=1 Tax=Streptomyces sp. NPDC048641 TaxID=3154825 RepID=UPI0034489AEF
MSATPSLKGLALVLFLLGSLVVMGSAFGVLVAGEHVWRFGVVGGGAVQFTGWVLHRRKLRHLRGGAA